MINGSTSFALQLPHLLYGLILASVVVMYGAVRYVQKQRSEIQIAYQMRRLRAPSQPWVTVLVYANKNGDSNLARHLKALSGSRYKAFDVVLVDDGVDRNIAAEVKAWRALFSKKEIQFEALRRRAHGNRGDALLAGYRKSHHGDLVIELDASYRIDHAMIKRAVAQFAIAKSKKSRNCAYRFALKTQLTADSLVAIIDSFRALLVTSHATISTSTYFKKSHVHAHGRSKSTRLVVRRSIPALTGGAIVVAATISGAIFGELLILWYGWVLYTTALLVGLWMQSESSNYERLLIAFSSPGALFLVPASGLIHSVSQRGRRSVH